MPTQRFLQALLLIILSATLTAQSNDCPYEERILSINGSTTKTAESKISSVAIHNAGTNVIYSAPEIQLDTPFTIMPNSSFMADNDGCISTCFSDKSPCEVECESKYETEENERGIRFVKHEVVLTFPQDVSVTFDANDKVIAVGDSQFFIPDLLDKFYTGTSTLGTLERCLCDDNIFFYRNENMIFEEGGLRQTNRAAGGVKEEGGAFSLNYIVDYAETPFQNDRFVFTPQISFEDRSYKEGDGTIVAFLDSGLNPEFVPERSLYYNSDPATFACGLPEEDPAGWNFVSNNSNLIDDRGHGTLTALSYIRAYENLADNKELIIDQRLLNVKVLDSCGEGTLYSALCGLKYAESKGAEVINCSWGLYQPDRNLQRVIEEITKNGEIQIVCSAGNAAITLQEDSHYPSGFARDHLSYESIESPAGEEGDIVQEIINNPIKGVWEIGGACRYIDEECANLKASTPLTLSSNYANEFLVEASKGIERLIPEDYRPDCQITGTSYAAPIFTAALARRKLDPNASFSKKEILGFSVRLHPAQTNFSFYLGNFN